ncbi:MAG: DegV family EDD domain-containing protein [Lachnospiraceae bacterium]|nr:DegV family EDD domain-containing protein [Lachnospiraceae bacterium]
MWRKFFKPFPVGEYDLKERMLRSVIQMGGIAVFLGMMERIIMTGESKIMLPVMLAMLLIIIFSLRASYKYHIYEKAAKASGLIVIVLVFPIMFLMNDGVNGGSPIWLALGLLYIFIMFRGKTLAVFLTLAVISYASIYVIAYRNPELLVSINSREMVYIDSFFALIVVSFIAGTIFQIHMRLFEKEHELNLRQKEELEKSSESKDIFFANMSHEIRTPINAIMGLNELILRYSEQEEVREYARDIQLASNMLFNQVNDILDFSQMEMSKMHLVPVDYHLGEVMKSLLDLVRVQADKKNLDVYIDIDKNLPSVLNGDEKRIKQVLLNILDNAIKYTEEGSVTLSVAGEEYMDNLVTLKIKVADTGIGIRKENLEGIYDAFNRYDEAQNKRILGTGLGLAITKQLIDMMDGEILVDSIYRKGTIFTIILKQKIIDKSPLGSIAYQDKLQDTQVEYKPLFAAPEARILVVDDSNMNRMVISRLLASTKVQVDTVANGMECLELTKQKFYHVILLDYLLPDMNGLQVLKAVRGQENGLCRDSAIIAVTGNTISGAHQVYLEQGFDGYVEKPIRGRALESEILQFLPSDIIEQTQDESITMENVGQIQKLSGKKRKRIYITTDCTCDIPQELLDKYDIKLMYLYIKTPHGRFADTREIDSDSIAQYITSDNSTAYGDKVSVAEIEGFFAEALTQAEEVIHISLGSKIGKSHGVAVEAAQGFDHVHVIDSGQISCGQALVVLYAAKLVSEGRTVVEVCEAVENMKNYVYTSFIMPGADIFYKSGRVSAVVAKACRIFQLHPYGGMKQKKPKFYAFLMGTLESAWRQGIYLSFLNKKRIDTEIVFITHVGCNVKQQEWLKQEILKRVPFENVITNKTSFTTACSVGMGTVGFAYYMQPKQ